MNTAKKLIESLKEDVKGPKRKVSPTYIKLVEFFPLQPISSRKQHEMALNIIEKLIIYTNDVKITDDGMGMYLKALSELVGDYEKNQFRSSGVSGVAMLAYIMDLQGLNQSDLSKELGGQPVVSKILKGERDLNLRQIKSLAKRFKVSPAVFI